MPLVENRDRNTKIFQRVANVHWRGNQIGPIKVDGVCFSGEGEIREGVVKFYKWMFQEGGESGWQLGVDGLGFEVL